MPLFTRDNARAMAVRGNIARWSRKDETPPEDETPAIPANDFTLLRLARIRKQLDSIDKVIAKELAKSKPDAQTIDRLASASMRLNEQEFALAGRPKPGQLRPAAPRRLSSGQAQPTLDVSSVKVLPMASEQPAQPAPQPSPAPSEPSAPAPTQP